MGDEDIIVGYSADPGVFYGPSSSHSHESKPIDAEEQTLNDASLTGPNVAGEESAPTSRPTVRGFLASAVGLTVILAAVGYYAFRETFGYSS